MALVVDKVEKVNLSYSNTEVSLILLKEGWVVVQWHKFPEAFQSEDYKRREHCVPDSSVILASKNCPGLDYDGEIYILSGPGSFREFDSRPCLVWFPHMDVVHFTKFVKDVERVISSLEKTIGVL